MIFKTSKSQGQVPDKLLLGILALLFVPEYLRAAREADTLIRAVSYVTAFAGTVPIVVLGFLNFRRSRIPKIVKFLMIFLMVWVVGWTTIWLFQVSGKGFITPLFNPALSVFTWLMFLLIPTAEVRLRNAFLFPTPKTTVYLCLAGILITEIFNAFLSITLNIRPFVFVILAAALLNEGSVKRIDNKTLLYCAVTFCMYVCFLTTFKAYRSYSLACAATLVLMLLSNLRQGFVLKKAFAISAIVVTWSSTALLLEYPEFLFRDLPGLIGIDMGADTRTFLILEYLNGATLQDIAVGRGLGGGYYSSFFYHLVMVGIPGGDSPFRAGVEIGAINVILKLGLVGLVPFLAITNYAVLRRGAWSPRFQGYIALLLIINMLFFEEWVQDAGVTYALWFAVVGVTYATWSDERQFHSKRRLERALPLPLPLLSATRADRTPALPYSVPKA